MVKIANMLDASLIGWAESLATINFTQNHLAKSQIVGEVGSRDRHAVAFIAHAASIVGGGSTFRRKLRTVQMLRFAGSLRRSKHAARRNNFLLL